ncbi:MAG TPA: endonuclease/exonuclease/phosphatase family protein [Gaiellaceae bacterium]|nr:endonuclease/exonuclease/phosphatase family protein [Gaiellaceae bacterium]
MTLLVRSWNVFHGNTSPPSRRSYLREMVELATRDRPDVLCLQELPVWALPRLSPWSGMAVAAAVARPGLRPAALAGWLTRVHNGLVRSALAGQANAILAAPERTLVELGARQVSDGGVERRVCLAVRVDGIVVATTHLSNERAGSVQRSELERVRSFAEASAREGEPVVLAGDLNLRDARLDGYSPPGPGIDHVLVRGAPAGPLGVWPRERRLHDGRLLSDHAPVELVLG